MAGSTRLRAVIALALWVCMVGAGRPDYYAVLGVAKDADAKAIKSAYRKMALKWHPDKNPDDREAAEKKFREVAEAYEVLSDKDKRAHYDRGGDGSGGGGGGGFGDFGDFGFGDFGFGGGGGRGGFKFKDPNDLFKDMFGSGDPFEDFSKFFDGVEVEDWTTGQTEADGALAKALAAFYAAVGQTDKATEEKAKELLRMPKWVGKERKMLNALQKKYSGFEWESAVSKLRKAFDEFDKSRGSQQGDGGFGGFGNMFEGMPGGMPDPFAGFGGFGGGGMADAFAGFGGGGGATMSFSSSSSSFSSGGKMMKEETVIKNGKRVTKKIETDSSGATRATLEEEEGGRVKRRSGNKRAEQLPQHDEM